MAVPRRLLARLAIVAVAAVGLLYGGVLLYTQVLNDAPDALDADDLAAALDVTTSTSTATVATLPASPDTTTTLAVADGIENDTASSWTIDAGSSVGYRVAEVLFGVNTEGVGRTDTVTGGITIVDQTLTEASFEVDVASITSDDGRRDNQFRGRIMDAATFPTANFALTEPVALGVDIVDEATVDIDIIGSLTLRGVTREVTASVTARVASGRIGILGSIPVVFTDFDIVDPSIPGITVEPDGLVEFVLVLSPVQ